MVIQCCWLCNINTHIHLVQGWIQDFKLGGAHLKKLRRAEGDAKIVGGLCLWRLTPLSTIVQLYHGGQFYLCRKPECAKKTIDMSQVTDTLYHIPRHERGSNSQL
jgi:hypothetical protein